MPFIEVKLAGELTREQKVQLSRGITDTVVRVTGKSEASVLVLIQALDRENWAKSGELLG